MPRARGSRQESRRGSTVQVIDNVVARRSQFARNTRSRHNAAALEYHNVVELRMIREQWCDPVLDEDVDLCTRQKALQREERRRGQNGVANRPQPNEKN